MSNYWRKKLDELEANENLPSNASNSSGYWGNKLTELEKETTKYGTSEAKITEIAPGEKGKEASWFQAGVFEDGYQIGDVSRALIGLGTDIHDNVNTAVLDATENLIDTTAYIVGAVGGIFSEDFKKDVGNFIAQDTLQVENSGKFMTNLTPVGWLNGIANNWDADSASVLGEKADGLVQSGAHLAGSYALQSTVGVPAWLTMGVNAFGSEIEQAFGQDATFEEAGISGAISAGAEILFEKISGGIKILKGTTLDEGVAKWLSENISNKVARTLLKYGIDIAGEGGEEVLTEAVSAVGRKMTYADEKEFNELFSTEDAFDAFIGGAVMGGVAGGGKIANSTMQGKDYTSGLTANEEAVVKAEVESRIAEKEASGEKLTGEQKNEIYDEVIRDLGRGEISTDAIESVLGGDDYKAYKDTFDSEDALLKEYNELSNLKEATLGQQQRFLELHGQANDIKTNSKATALKDTLGKNVYGKLTQTNAFGNITDGRLAESYHERARRGVAFEADLSKIDAKYQDTYKRASESGILNNTRRSHEFVDMVAKISADKGVSFDFANNEKLKASGFAVDGATINGFVTKDGVTVNIDSAKSLNSVVGHEITHVLEGTELYTELQTAIKAYAEAKGDYQGRYDSLSKLYEGVEGADIDAELTADLVGDYLFDDNVDFINNLSVNNKNVFKKIYDEIKYLYKIATAGSKEKRQLEKVKKAFEQAYRADTKAGEGVKYSMSDSDGKALSNEQNEYFKNSKMRDENGNLKVMYHGSQDAGFHTFDASMSDDGTSFFFVDRNDVAASYSGTSETYAPRVFKSAEDANNFLKEMGFYGGKYGYEVVENDGEYTLFAGDEAIATSDNMAEIYEEFCDYEGVGYGDANYKVYLNLENPLTIDAEGRNWNNISREYSQEVYDRYKSLTDSEKTALAEIAGWDEYGIFKDEILSMARAKANGKYYDTDLASAYEKLGGANANLYDAFSIASDNFSEDSIKEFAVKQMNTRDYAAKAKAEGYDGVIFKNIHDNGGYSNGSEGASTVAIAFSSEQIKSVANEKPTKNKDIRYSLSEDSEGRKLSENQEKYFKGSKVVDDSGKLKAVYHGSPSDFNEFSLKYLGTNGTNEGYGFYFTDSKRIAEGYSKGREGQQNGEGGRLFEVYLDIKKPLSDTEVTMSRAQFKKLLTELNNQVDEDGEPLEFLSNYGDVSWEGLNKVLNYAMEIEYDGSDSDVNMVHSIINACGDKELVFDLLRKVTGYDGIIVNEATWGGDQTIYIAFHPEQIKNVDNLNPTDNPDIRKSLTKEGEAPARRGRNSIMGEDVRFDAPKTESIAPMPEAAPEAVDNAVDDAVAPSPEGFAPVTEEESLAMARDNLASLTDEDAPMEAEAPYYSEDAEPSDPFESRDIKDVGKRNVKAYMYENPEVKPYFQMEANAMLGELRDTIKGEKTYTRTPEGRVDEYGGIVYGSESYGFWSGTKRHTTDDIAYLLDSQGYSYAEIEAGLKAIIEDNGAENNACSKRIEFLLNDRLLNGYQDLSGYDIPANQEYINLLNEKQITEYNDEARKSFFESVGATESAPTLDDIAPIGENVQTDKAYEAIRPPKKTAEPRMKRAKPGEIDGQQTISESKKAEILTTEPDATKKQTSGWSKFVSNFVDKQSVFERLSLKTKNRELMGKANQMHNAESSAQWLIGHGSQGVKALNDIRTEVEKTGHEKEFYEYMYHQLNTDRMTLADRYEDVPNKPVFGDSVTAEASRAAISELEKKYPDFKRYANDVYAYNSHLRRQLVNSGVISEETAKLWAEMYPHYVPVRRLGDAGLNVNVPLFTERTGVNAPIKKATGGNRDILPMFDTMAMRTEQTYKAVAKNRFGVELKNTLGTTVDSAKASLDEVIEGIDNHEGLLQEGKDGKNPTFTVFEDGKKVTFEISEEMYEALKPTGKGLSYTNKALSKVNDIRRGLITEYNPVFMATNAIKDAQDVLINSQHATKTYANIPIALKELSTKGKWYTEYMENGGENNTYFDGQKNTFKKEDNAFKKVIGMPLRAISAANNFVERAPRLAEYIASRKNGASVEVAMLDAARVTTNFAAGGDVTKFLNRNGATFLNASVQGAAQQVRNIREAKANGLKGWVQLAAKVTLAGLPAMLLNNLLWEDDEEYEELSDYVKDNYYIVAKYGDGQFVRIPKGRTVAVIQEAFEQVSNALTGDDEVDLANFLELAISNLAPNNPIDNNIIAPITQAATNKTWYGDDLVPTRLQDLPEAEQYDESTDALSKWLGEKLNISPYKINYVLDQYSGGVGDVILPMITPESDGSGALAPFTDKFTTDSVLNNQNVSDFYDTMDELTKNANSMHATDEDVLSYKYMNSVNSELGELYAQKREIQSSDLSDAEKDEAIRELQEQINSLMRNSLSSYGNVRIDNGYATVGDLHYRWYEPGEDSTAEAGWQKISDKQLEKQNEVTRGLGISASEYWSNKEEYDYAYENPEKYTVAKAVGGYTAYRNYASELYDIKADKDSSGKSIVGSRKEKVAEYINNLDADYGEKIILFKSEYPADDTYNYEIIEYLNSREDISYEEMATILKELGFTVDSNGNIYWD